uniref:Bm9038 n=1 Tax=Brugia malayi TaxID=6279 RepID=A0A1I9GEY8_BRUMA|nr:Bm9038 [Brugia malayi]
MVVRLWASRRLVDSSWRFWLVLEGNCKSGPKRYSKNGGEKLLIPEANEEILEEVSENERKLKGRIPDNIRKMGQEKD